MGAFSGLPNFSPSPLPPPSFPPGPIGEDGGTLGGEGGREEGLDPVPPVEERGLEFLPDVPLAAVKMSSTSLNL